MSVKIIVNPAARRGDGLRLARELKSLAGERGDAVWVETQRAGHAVDLARQAAEEGCSVVAAVGGDGTVHEVANGLMRAAAEARPALGVVPIGSGNDFVVGAGLRADPQEALLSILSSRETRPLDLGRVRDNNGRDEYFVNVIGIGLDASVTYRARNMRWLRGFPMYLGALMRAMIQDFHTPHVEIAFDDGRSVSGPAMMIAVSNGTREGGGFNITPRADIADGVLDFAMIGPVSRARLLRIIPDVMKGTHERHPEIRFDRVRRLGLRSRQPLAVHFDGDMFAWHGDGVRELDISIVPGAIRLVV